MKWLLTWPWGELVQARLAMPTLQNEKQLVQKKTEATED
jgi:hypothetical protein